MRVFFRVFIFLVALSALSCASTSPKPAFQKTARDVYARTGYRIHWNLGSREDDEVKKRIRKLLEKPLHVEEALQIGLLNNRGLQATYEELGVAQADLVQAGLLKNPVLSGSIHFPLTADAQSDMTVSLAQDFIGLFMIPAKKNIASARLEAARFKVGDAVMAFAHKLRLAYYNAQSAEQVHAMRQAVAEAGAAAIELARNQHEAGNINDLELSQQEALYEQIDLDALRAEGDVITKREELIRLLGLWGLDIHFRLMDKLPELPNAEPALEDVEAIAVKHRLDLAAAQRETASIGLALGLVTDFRWIADLNVGLVYERTFIGPSLLGPGASIELPIFDQRQAQIARMQALFRQSQSRTLELYANIRSEVRSARSRVLYARRVVERYSGKLVPLREKVTMLSQAQYNAMLIGVFQLLTAKQNEVNAFREFIEALKDYWVAQADLERAAGGRITMISNAQTQKEGPSR